MEAAAVIGMNYGDEGKGHITNYLSDENTLNIRFNGGAQASHAVFLADGRSHVFHHFGSGSLRGARTLLASHFIINPMIFAWELQGLSGKVPMREVFIDPRCRITTPYDMMVNEFSARFNHKNDTTGVGINETVERSTYRQLQINTRDFVEKSDSELTEILKTIQNEYLPFRIGQIKAPWDDFKKYHGDALVGNSAVESFLRIREWMVGRMMVMWPDDSVIDKFLSKDKERRLVFEAGQGMLLDQHRKEFFPYLTRSSTGIRNVLELLKTVRTKLSLRVYLITRTYLTRHGDGPMWNHVPNTFPFPGIDEPTNIENKYQGKMRYGHLNKAWYEQAIQETEAAIKKDRPACLVDTAVNVAMTCLDHMGPEFIYSRNGDNDLVKGEITEFPKVSLLSSGRTERDVRSNEN